MYSYKKEKKFPKRKLIVSLLCLFAVSVSYLSYEYYEQTKPKDTAVFNEETMPVLALPSSASQTLVKPFLVDAQIAIDYFDGKESERETVNEFEGIYRGNQGIDYTFQEDAFEIIASMQGTIQHVVEDPIFGKSVTIVHEDISVTYQSLSEIAVKDGDVVQQNDVIGKAGKNIYNKELGNHVHVVVEKNGKIMDPKLVYNKAIDEIK